MRKQERLLEDFYRLLANIDIRVYALMSVASIVLFVLGWLNERVVWQRRGEGNSAWDLFCFLCFGRQEELKFQKGIARKFMIITGGFMALISAAYYETNLLQSLMAPQKHDKATVESITQMITGSSISCITYCACLFVIDGTSRAFFLRPDTSLEKSVLPSPLLGPALREHTPIYAPTPKEQFHLIRDNNAIFFDNIAVFYEMLAQLKAHECAELEIAIFTELLPSLNALIVTKENRNVYEMMNLLTMERLDYLNRFLPETVNRECVAAMNVEVDDLSFKPLQLNSLIGAILLLLPLYLCSICLLLIEFAVYAFQCWLERQFTEEQKHVHIDFHVDFTVDYKWQYDEIMTEYYKLIHMVQDDGGLLQEKHGLLY